MTKIRVFHGTAAAPFDEFRIPPSGAHFGSFDQAAHAATLKLARMPAKEFALLKEDAHGWRGRILEVEIELRNPLRIKDARTGAAWSKVIARATAAGHDSLIYEYDYEGGRPEESYVVFTPEQIEILSQDARMEEGAPCTVRPAA